MKHMDMEFEDAGFDEDDANDHASQDDDEFADSAFDDLADLFPSASRGPVRMRASKPRAYRDGEEGMSQRPPTRQRRMQDRHGAAR